MFILTWTGFRTVLESVLSTAWIAITLAALGLVLRGAGFALRKPTRAKKNGVRIELTPNTAAYRRRRTACRSARRRRVRSHPVGNRAGRIR